MKANSNILYFLVSEKVRSYIILSLIVVVMFIGKKIPGLKEEMITENIKKETVSTAKAPIITTKDIKSDKLIFLKEN